MPVVNLVAPRNIAGAGHQTGFEINVRVDALGVLVLPVVHGGGFLRCHGGGSRLFGHHERGHNGSSKNANHCYRFLWVGVDSEAASPRGDNHRRPLKLI